MSSAKTIAKNTAFLFSTSVLDKIVSFFIVIVITRFLGDVGFGKYSFAFAFIAMFTIFPNFGVSTYILREISKDKSKTKELIGNAVALRLLIALIVFSIAIVIAKFWPKTNEIFLGIILVAIYSFFGMFTSLTKILFTAYEKNEFTLYSITLEKIITLILSYYVLTKGYGLNVLLLVFVFSNFINSVYNYIITYRHFVKVSFSIDLKLWKSIIKNSIPFWFTLLFQRIYYKTDTIMLTAMKNYAVTGWYNAASTLTAALTFIPDIIIFATFPAMSRFHHTNSNENLRLLYHKSAYYVLSIGIPLSIGISLLAQRLILFIYKEQFIKSGIILQVLSWSLIFVFVNGIMGYLLNSINKQHLFTISSGICAGGNVILNLILIPQFSYMGAAFATVITQFINFCSLYYFTKKNGHPLNLIKVSYRPIIAGSAMGILIYYISFLHILYIVPIAVIAYFAVLLIMGGLGKEEINLIKSFFPKR
ncbi:MAG: flippase [Nanoarchaeota archaeon]|nr:flippase [Nanoarchaeota archaeon]